MFRARRLFTSTSARGFKGKPITSQFINRSSTTWKGYRFAKNTTDRIYKISRATVLFSTAAASLLFVSKEDLNKKRNYLYGFLGVNAIIFGAISIRGNLANYLVAHTKYSFRPSRLHTIVSANFTHLGIFHLALNCWAAVCYKSKYFIFSLNFYQ